MRRLLSVEGACRPDEVWDRYVRPERWHEWSPQIQGVETADATLRAGTTGIVHGPAGLRVRFTVSEVEGDPPVRSWSWRATALGVPLRLHHTVEPAGSGTRTTLSIEGAAPTVTLYAPIARLALERLVRP